MKRKLCFRITAKLRNLKRQHYPQQEGKKKIKWEPLFKKACEEKEEKKKSLFCSHMNRKSTSYA